MSAVGHGLLAAIRSVHRGKPAGGVRYPTGLRRQVTALVRRHQRVGEALAAVAHQLGIPVVTLQRRLQAPQPGPSFRRIAPGV